MEPLEDFEGKSKVYGPAPGNEDTVRPLAVYEGPLQLVTGRNIVSIWQLDDQDFEILKETRRLYLIVSKTDAGLPPMQIMAMNPGIPGNDNF